MQNRTRLWLGLCLLALVLPHSIQAADAPIERLLYGDAVTHSFSPDIPSYQFSFEAVKGDTITLTVVGKPDKTNEPVIDPALAIFDPTGQLVAQNDDSLDPTFGMTNARIVDFPISANGLYGIHVTRNQQATPSDGAFTITLKAKTSDQSRATINFTQIGHGVITSALPSIQYSFHATKGDVIIGQAKGVTNGNNSALSPMLTLQDATDATLLSAATTKSSTTTVMLAPVLIAEDNVYTLVVSRSPIDKRTSPGAFNVTVTRDRSGVYIAYGDKLTGTITSVTSETQYIFQGKAGDTITITMVAQDAALDAKLNLRTEADKLLSTSQNGGKGLTANDAQIVTFRLPSTGIYVIAAGRVGSTIGGYTIQLDLVKAGS